MAKEKVEKSEFDSILKEFGAVIKSGKSVLESRPIIIPVSPALDIALGGGITDGATITLAGPPKAGKSVTALWIAANAQNKKYALPGTEGREVFYANIEGRLKARDLEGIPHLDLSRFHVIGSSPNDAEGKGGKILMAQEYLSIIEKIIHQKPGSIIIVDSFSALVTSEEYTGSMEDMQRASGAKLLYKFFRKISNVIPVNRTILLAVNHVIANPGMGNPNSESSGRAVQYFADFRLMCKFFTFIKPGGKDSTDSPIGQEVNWVIACSGLGSPGATPTSIIKYGKGIDQEQELAQICIDLGIIVQSGAWYQFPNEEKKIQGINNVKQHLVDNPELYKTLFSQVKEMMGIKCY
jgi:RecA/RadA recombinase